MRDWWQYDQVDYGMIITYSQKILRRKMFGHRILGNCLYDPVSYCVLDSYDLFYDPLKCLIVMVWPYEISRDEWFIFWKYYVAEGMTQLNNNQSMIWFKHSYLTVPVIMQNVIYTSYSTHEHTNNSLGIKTYVLRNEKDVVYIPDMSEPVEISQSIRWDTIGAWRRSGWKAFDTKVYLDVNINRYIIMNSMTPNVNPRCSFKHSHEGSKCLNMTQSLFNM